VGHRRARAPDSSRYGGPGTRATSPGAIRASAASTAGTSGSSAASRLLGAAISTTAMPAGAWVRLRREPPIDGHQRVEPAGRTTQHSPS